MSWTDEQIDEYVMNAYTRAMNSRDELEEKYALNDTDSWALDQKTGQLIFEDAKGPILVCKTYALGTLGEEKWQWAWANDSLDQAFSNKSQALKALGEKSGLGIFDLDAFEADEHMPWEFAGMALKEIGGLGVYCCEAASADLYVIIEAVTKP